MGHSPHAIPINLPPGEIRAVERAPALERLSWALYDFANTIFSMNVASLYFTVWLVSDLGVSSTLNAVANGAASVLVVISIPFLGALSDARRRRKPWVVGFTLLSCVALATLGFLGQTLLPLTGDSVPGAVAMPAGWHASALPLYGVLAAFVIAMFAYQAAQPFYNAM